MPYFKNVVAQTRILLRHDRTHAKTFGVFVVESIL